MRREQRADKDHCATDAVVRNSIGRSTMNHRMKRYQYIYIYIYIYICSKSIESIDENHRLNASRAFVALYRTRLLPEVFHLCGCCDLPVVQITLLATRAG